MTTDTKVKSKVEILMDEMVKESVSVIMDKLKLIKIVTTKDLTNILDMDGKLLRRHLRNQFSSNHTHQQTWLWTNDDKELKEIISYFAKLTVKKSLVK